MIDRRSLFRAGAAAAVVTACRSPEPAADQGAPAWYPPPEPDAEAGVPAVADAPYPELATLSIAELARHSATDLVAMYRARVGSLDGKLHSILELARDAETTALRLDGERAAGRARGLLHGMPILVKDNIDTGDTMRTSAGSHALTRPAPRDAFVVAKLRQAGALILGKANLSEWANFRGHASISGWSGRGGQCRNPYALDRSPSGSSSGSAVATAAGLCAASLGSETDGSITSPASACSLVGMKPTIGLVSRAGVIPISASQDTVGPIARTVTDAALVLTAIAGFDPEDPITAIARPEDYTKHLDPKALAGARIGVPRKGWFGLSRCLDSVTAVAVAKLAELGAEIVDCELTIAPALGDAELTVLYAELKDGMNAYLARRGDPEIRTLLDLIAFDLAHPRDELHLFDQSHFDVAQAKPGTHDAAYLHARATCLELARDHLDAVLHGKQLDALVMCTGGVPWLIDPIGGDASTTGPNTTVLPAVAGYPHITVPAGAFRGLPIGLSFVGARFTEAKLFGYAYAFEQATHHRRPPRYLASAHA